MFKKLSAVIMMVVFGIMFQAASVFALEKVVEDETVANVYKVENLVQVADNVVVLFDSSSSMAAPYHKTGKTKLQAAKQLLKQRVEAFPEVFPKLNFGLYSYTPGTINFKGYETFYKMQPFNKSAFLQAVDQLPEEAKGPTLMQNALSRLDELLAQLSGNTVVFLFTDGSFTDMRVDKSVSDETEEWQSNVAQQPVNMAKKLAEKYDVNFQVISSTDLATNLEMIKQVASVNASSRVIPLEILLDRPEVYTGAVFAIEESYIVEAETREKVVGFRLDHVLFGFDKSDIEVEFTDELKAVGTLLRENPESYIVLAGFTDSVGPEEYNIALSRRRAEAVGAYLAEKFDIDADRVTLFWYGEAIPVADNDTEEGRRKNRRVIGFVAGVN